MWRCLPSVDLCFCNGIYVCCIEIHIKLRPHTPLPNPARVVSLGNASELTHRRHVGAAHRVATRMVEAEL
jgi:hypothetical protein